MLNQRAFILLQVIYTGRNKKHQIIIWFFFLQFFLDFITDEKYLDDINTRWNEIIPFLLDYNNTVAPKDRDLVSQKIRQEYFQGREVSKETFPVLVQVCKENY